eukprot:COSAG06_NODE_3114_length_5840_cov_26.926842_1_plen_87_part_00
MLSEQPQRALLYASKTPRYQTATFRPVRAPVLPGYGPGDHMRVRTAANGVRNGRRGDACTVVDVAVPLLDAVVVDEKGSATPHPRK